MPGDAASAAASLASDGGLIAPLGELLRYGIPGLALAVLILAYFSLRGLQKDALGGRAEPAQIKPFVHLQYAYLAVIVLLVMVTLVGPKFVGAPVNSTHRIAFSVSPTSFERTDLTPRLIVAGGTRIDFRDGTSQDSVTGDRAYTFDVGPLVREGDFLRAYIREQDLRRAAAGGQDGR
ncbi:MAG TPA: hypothetical protein VGE47_00610 [Burkholderiaceae bacterium]